MHETANGEMQHHQAEEFLPNQFLRLAAQEDVCAANMGLQFVQGGLDIPLTLPLII
jgi:hypothetical protein